MVGRARDNLPVDGERGRVAADGVGPLLIFHDEQDYQSDSVKTNVTSILVFAQR
jgi:hypothetical protein